MLLNKNKINSFSSNKKIKLYTTSISAGFPSPAEDHMDVSLDINEYLVKHPSSTFYIYVKGDSMINSGIFDGDLMIVDRSLEVKSNSIVVAVINGEFTVKKIKKDSGNIYLIPDNKNYKPILLENSMDFQIWGIVTHTIHHFL
tara:strand:- start:2859 stop:3287 length:429 start_codon:yes stop_codon:yes gene_type:complete